MNKKILTTFIIGLVAIAAVAAYFFWDAYMNGKGTNMDMLSGRRTPILAVATEYRPGTVGYYARPDDELPHPGVILIHEWWGLNENIKEAARTLASEGYHVLAVNLFGSVATTPEQARAQTSGLDQEEALANMNAAYDYLKARGATKMASYGWCFGGGQSMQFSLSGRALDATVIYYGNLVTDEARLRSIRWPVLGIFGDQDTSVTPESARAFDAALSNLGIEHEVKIYEGVGHAFANPSGANYAPGETRDAWERTLTFLGTNLR